MNNLLEYNGYFGSVAYSAPDGVFHGKLIGISDRITYEGDSVTSLTLSFEDAVDDYIECCTEIGKPPDLPSCGRRSVAPICRVKSTTRTHKPGTTRPTGDVRLPNM
jgi:predicted HicB family RNase H-like nuclease